MIEHDSVIVLESPSLPLCQWGKSQELGRAKKKEAGGDPLRTSPG
jgi:hypothetical protein